MATTPKGFYYPVSSDSPDVPLHMQTLATDVDEYFDGVSTASKTETLTNKTISGASNTLSNIPNSALTNSSITINGSPVSLGGTTTIAGDLPSQTGQSGKYLTTNGSTASWATVSAGDTLPSQTGNSGKYLTTDGSTTSWATISADINSVVAGTGLTGGGTSGDVTLNLDTTSAYVVPSQTSQSGKFLTTNGTSSSWSAVPLSSGVSGTLPIANGGTGQTTSTAAINALLPSQTSNSGKFLTTDGTNISWATAGSSLPGAWTSYTFTEAGYSNSGAAKSGYYVQIGKTVHMYADGTVMGSPTGFMRISTPVTGSGKVMYGIAYLNNANTATSYLGSCYISGDGSAIYIAGFGTNGQYINQTNSSTIPFQWVASTYAFSGSFRVMITYEAA